MPARSEAAKARRRVRQRERYRTDPEFRAKRKAARGAQRGFVPLLPAEPFAAWLEDMSNEHGGSTVLGALVGCDESWPRAFIMGRRAFVQERTVERFGLALSGDPGLVARLYGYSR